jgi:tetratricopeptide (TPR) repeat protein
MIKSKILSKINILILGFIALILLGGCGSSADDERMKNAEDQIKNESFDGAASALNNTQDKKGLKLRRALMDYDNAVSNFYNYYGSNVATNGVEDGYNPGFEDTYKLINEIDTIYKKYDEFEAAVKAWKRALKSAINFEKDLLKDYKKMNKYKDKEDYDKCIEIAEKWNQKIEKEFPVDDEKNGDRNEFFVERLEYYTHNFSEDSLIRSGADTNSGDEYSPVIFDGDGNVLAE